VGAGTKEQDAKVEIPRKAMSRVPWPTFKERQPRAHLVVATMEADFLVGPNLQAAQQLLQRFITKQKAIERLRDDGCEGCRPSGGLYCFRERGRCSNVRRCREG
jgi:hypothetical protein